MADPASAGLVRWPQERLLGLTRLQTHAQLLDFAPDDPLHLHRHTFGSASVEQAVRQYQSSLAVQWSYLGYLGLEYLEHLGWEYLAWYSA